MATLFDQPVTTNTEQEAKKKPNRKNKAQYKLTISDEHTNKSTPIASIDICYNKRNKKPYKLGSKHFATWAELFIHIGRKYAL